MGSILLITLISEDRYDIVKDGGEFLELSSSLATSELLMRNAYEYFRTRHQHRQAGHWNCFPKRGIQGISGQAIPNYHGPWIDR
jgi:hypothetical protein